MKKITEDDKIPFLIHLAKLKVKEMQETEDGKKLFPEDNTMRERFYTMGFVDGFTEGAFFKANKEKVIAKNKKRILTFD